MYDFYEAIEPEPTDEEVEADYVDHLLQTAPPIQWECYCERDNECHVCREEALANAAGFTASPECAMPLDLTSRAETGC